MTRAGNTVKHQAEVIVGVAPGDGRVARRDRAVLFDPTGDRAELVACFDAAADDEQALAAVKQQLIAAGSDTAPLVLISWADDGIDLLVLGGIDVHTSATAAAMITGAGSATWVERRLGRLELHDSALAQVWCGAEADPATDLRHGIVRCGGIRVSRPWAPDAALAADPPRAEAQPAAASPPVVEPVAEAQPAAASLPPPADPFRPTAQAPVSATTSVPAGDFFDHGLDDELTEPSDQRAERDLVSTGFGLVESVVCAAGHANPPRTAECRVCVLALGDRETTLIEQPVVGAIQLADGRVVPVDRRLVLGRKPAVDDVDAATLSIDQAEVSRSHVEIAVEGWAVLLTDLGSRNGTWVTPPNDPTPVKLDDGVPHLLEHGTTVHLGGVEAAFTYDAGGRALP